jgi:pSer/pThr/pTyr-binding forkhead associated (FHA) protein
VVQVSECAKCGAALEEQAHSCVACGAPVADATASFDPVEKADAEDVVAPTLDGPALVVRKGPQPGEKFYLDRAKLTMGRDPESDIFLNDMTVSRVHARLDMVGGIVTVTDAGSLNGTYVNGVCADQAMLDEGDVLQIGTFQMLFFCAKDSAR